MSNHQDPQHIIKLLGLEPHPEGGYFKETFRDTDNLPNGRSASTLIYFLIEAGNHSSLHRIDAAEGWHFYAGQGNGIEVIELAAQGPRITKLGIDFAAGQRPQHVVPKDVWFGARMAEDSSNATSRSWALVGCTVAPAFDFDKFELGKRSALLQEFHACRDVILALTPQD